MDKSALIAFTNKKINTQQSYICLSRPRRFGKSMAMDMLSAYYSLGKDSRELFKGLRILQDESFETYRNQFHVLKLDVQAFSSKTNGVADMIALINQSVIQDLKNEFADLELPLLTDLGDCLYEIFARTSHQFVVLIDEWDSIMRRYHNEEEQKRYLDYLRNLLKDQPYIALSYMTGILPIKKYGEHSTLNMFLEYSMIDSAEISDCFGFTEWEVQGLCEKYGMDFQDAREWYDGYKLIEHPENDRKLHSIYSPKSIVESMLRRKYGNYWNQTETYEALKEYISLNLDGLKDAITSMLSGESIEVDTETFQNDFLNLNSRDEVLTLLVHLGYLAFNQDTKSVYLPNKEVSSEFVRSIKSVSSFGTVSDSIQASKVLLERLFAFDEEAVAEGIAQAHQEVPMIKYNDENSLSCAITLAFYYAREYYTIIRELPTGKGFADISFIPKPNHVDKPALLIELKYDKAVDSAMNQIKSKNYAGALSAYTDSLLLCGITYHSKSKEHVCCIEKYER